MATPRADAAPRLQEGITTGISAAERTATVRALADAGSTPDTFVRPGHIFPLRYREGGVLRRAGHTEAAVDLARLAGRAPVGVLCEVRFLARRTRAQQRKARRRDVWAPLRRAVAVSRSLVRPGAHACAVRRRLWTTRTAAWRAAPRCWRSARRTG